MADADPGPEQVAFREKAAYDEIRPHPFITQCYGFFQVNPNLEPGRGPIPPVWVNPHPDPDPNPDH